MRKLVRGISIILLVVALYSMQIIGVFAEDLGTSTSKASMQSARYLHGAVELNGKIYALGGVNNISMEEYNPETDTWVSKANMLSSKRSFNAVAINDKIYAVGGKCDDGSLNMNVDEYDTINNVWVTKTNLSNSKGNCAAVTVNNKIYIIGGDYDDYLNTVDEYDTVSNTWVTKSPMPTARNNHSAVVVNGKIYVIGGLDGSSALNTVEEYDPLTDTWSTKTPMPTPRYCFGATVVGNKIYTFGGIIYDGTNTIWTSIIEEYDTETDSWRTIGNMTSARTSLKAVSVSDKMYLIGGYVNDTALNIVEEYSLIKPPAAPQNVSAVAGNSQVSLSWGLVTGATSYNIKSALNTGGPYETVASGVYGNNFTDINLVNGTTYYYVVSAVNVAGESVNSVEVSATPKAASLGKIMLKTEDGFIYSGDLVEQNSEIFKLTNVCLVNGIPSFTPGSQPTYNWEISFFKNKVIWYYFGQ